MQISKPLSKSLPTVVILCGRIPNRLPKQIVARSFFESHRMLCKWVNSKSPVMGKLRQRSGHVVPLSASEDSEDKERGFFVLKPYRKNNGVYL